MLYRFREVLRDQKIPFYWNDNVNLIEDLKKSYLGDCYGQLNNFIRKIDQYVTSNDASALNQYISMCSLFLHCFCLYEIFSVSVYTPFYSG